MFSALCTFAYICEYPLAALCDRLLVIFSPKAHFHLILVHLIKKLFKIVFPEGVALLNLNNPISAALRHSAFSVNKRERSSRIHLFHLQNAIRKIPKILHLFTVRAWMLCIAAGSTNAILVVPLHAAATQHHASAVVRVAADTVQLDVLNLSDPVFHWFCH